MDPVYVVVTILHKIHYSIEVPKTKKRIIGFQNIIGFFIITLWVLLLLLCATGSDVITGSDVSHVTGSGAITESDASHVTGSDVTGSDVILPRFFLTIVVVQNVPLLFIIRFTASDYSFDIFWSLCCLSFDLRLLIISLVSFGKIGKTIHI